MTTVEEYEAIRNMLKRAREYKLDVEVIWSFFNAIKGKPDRDLAEAIFIALGEWDV